MLPEVGSTIVPPGFSSPDASAASIIRTAIRSFTEPPGLRYSTLASTSDEVVPTVRLSLTSGVLPISSRREFAYFMPANLPARRGVPNECSRIADLARTDTPICRTIFHIGPT